MNQQEWKHLLHINKYSLDFTYYNKTRKIQKSLCYEQDPNAKIIHHLRDTEEQRKYNDEHYELWGFEIDENGNEHFEYGKYVVFWTKGHHDEYHSQSEETKKKRSDSLKGRPHTQEHNQKVSKSLKGHKVSDETRQKLSISGKGRKHSEETKLKISESHKRYDGEEYRRKLSKSSKAMWEDAGYRDRVLSKMQRTKSSSEARNKMSRLMKGVMDKKSHAYKIYKEIGGTLSWNDFQKEYAAKNNDLFAIPK